MIGLSGRWDPQIVMDCPWGPGPCSLGPSRESSSCYRTSSTPTIECRTCLSVEGLCGWLWVGVDLSSESFCSPPFWPVFRRFARRVFSTPGLCWRSIYERRGVWRAWASPIPETTNVCGACPSPPSRPDGPPAATKHHTRTHDRPTGGPPARSIPSQAVAGGRGQTCRCALPQATGFRP